MTTTEAPTRAGTPAVRTRRAAVWSVPSVRWAAAAATLFAAGAVAHLADAPAAVWWTLYLACYLAGGWGPAAEGLQALRERRLDVDLLMILAALGAAAIGQVFDGALLIVIFATSGALEDVATRRTRDSVHSLLDLTPEQGVRIAADGTETPVSAVDLEIGDEVIIRPGQRIPADGTVTDGASDVDQSTITGEAMPVSAAPGDEVFAGTLNGSGVLRVTVTRGPSETVVARIVAMVAEASATKAKTQLFIEKVEQRYSAGVVVATIGLFTVPLLLGVDLRDALLRAMTFMIVASPCALVLATMPPLLSAIANAGRHGILVKSAVAMERLADTSLVALDKTGTLTRGTPSLTHLSALGGGDPDDLLRTAAAAEQYSEHPIGRAIVAEARRRGIAIPQAHDFRALPGRGVRAEVAGRPVAVLATTDFRDTPAVADLERSGATVVVVTVADRPAGVLGLSDPVRSDAGRAVTAVERLTGHRPVLLTGDHRAAATHLAGGLGITDVRAGLLPADKVEAVRALQADGRRVLLGGDGVNDAPAMAVAHTSIAMGRSGSDLSIETADAVTVRDELTTIPAVVALARRARRVVVANLVIAGTVIVALVTWDLVGHLPLPLGVAGHEGSTILVALNGLRLLSDRAWRRAAAE